MHNVTKSYLPKIQSPLFNPKNIQKQPLKNEGLFLSFILQSTKLQQEFLLFLIEVCKLLHHKRKTGQSTE